ncbi:MAG: flippase-like domain-containing protein [Bacteroidetes bacterium]|nr:flippase-like domain-containing protein [Bacteroidota bacterium]
MKISTLTKYILLLFQYLLAVVILYFIFKTIVWNDFAEVIKSINIWNLLVVFLLAIIIQYLQIVRWGFLLKNYDFHINWKDIIESYFIGITAGFITPGQVGEFFARKINLKNHSLIKISTLAFVDKLYLSGTTYLLGIIGIFYLGITFFIQELELIISLILILVLIFTSLLLFTNLTTTLIFNILNKIKNLFNLSTSDFKLDNYSFQQKFRLFGNGIFITFLISLQFYFTISSFTNINLMNVFAGSSSLLFIKSFIFFAGVGDLGIREGLSIYIFTKLGITASVALGSALLIFFYNLLLPSIIGLVFLIKRNK